MKLKLFVDLFFYFFFVIWMMHRRLAFAEKIELFKGDISLRQYLQHKLCGVKSFVLIENFRFENQIATGPNTTEWPQIERVLARTPNCVYRRYGNLNMSQLNEQLPTIELFLHFRTTQLIFDLSNFQITDRSTFALVLQTFGQIYEHCSPCTPFLVLFDHSLGPQRLFEWSMFALAMVSSTFQSALIADLDSTMVTVLCRPVLDGCRSTEPIFWPQSLADFARLNVDFGHCNLHSITLNVSVNQHAPICSFTRDPTNNELIPSYSVDFEFLKMLAKHYNFMYRLIDGQQVRGMPDPVTGKWNGVIGQVINGTSNMAMCGIIRTNSRYSVVDFTRHTLNTGITFISHSPKRLDAAQLIVPTLFTVTWYGLIAAFFLLALMLYGTLRRSHSYHCVLQMFFAITMRQSGNKLMSSLRTDSSRLLWASWLITTMIVYNFYGSIIFSLLTVFEYGPAIDTIDDLVREANGDRSQIVVAQDSAFQQEFMYSQPDNPILYAIGRHLNRTLPNSLLKMPRNIFDYIRQNPKKIGIISRYYSMYQRKAKPTPPLYIGSDDIWEATTGIVLPKRSPLLYPFNHVIVKFREHGNFMYWLRRTGIPDMNENEEDDRSITEEMKAISVQDIAWLFKLFRYAYPISAFVLLIEIGVRKWRWAAKDCVQIDVHDSHFFNF